MGAFGPRLQLNPQIGGARTTEVPVPSPVEDASSNAGVVWADDEAPTTVEESTHRSTANLQTIAESMTTSSCPRSPRVWPPVETRSSTWTASITNSSNASYHEVTLQNNGEDSTTRLSSLMHQSSFGRMSIHPWLEGQLEKNTRSGRTVRIADFKSTRRFLIHPEESSYMYKWDGVMMISLLFVCLVTPYEVAFLLNDSAETGFVGLIEDPMFWMNRLMDVIFVTDMVLQFFLMYPVESRFGAFYVSDRKSIVQNYMRKWFIIDVVSIIPYEMLATLVHSDGVLRFRVLRAFRLLRLFKMFRVLRGLRVLQRWEAEMKTSYRRMTLWGLLVTVFFAAHWMTCFLGLLSRLQDPCTTVNDTPFCVGTWFTPHARRIAEQGLQLNSIREYLAVLNVVSTILVHPYAASPVNAYEQACFTILLFVGGFIWTRVISRTTAVYTSLDRHRIFYRQTMDDLNRNMMDQMLTEGLQSRLRSFFMSMRDSSQRSTWSDLQKRMSPSLQIQVAVELHTVWLRRVPFLAGSSRFLIAALAQRIGTEHYAQQETFGQNFRLYVMNRGVCSRTSPRRGKIRLHLPGSVWGLEHLVFQTVNLLEPNSAATMTFCEVLVLRREDFEEVTIDFPENSQRIRKYYVKMAVIRGIIKYARQLRQAQHSSPLGSGSPLQWMVKFSTQGDFGEPDDEEGEYRDHAARMKRALARTTRATSHEDRGCPSADNHHHTNSPHAADELHQLEERLSAQISRGFSALTLQLEAFKAEMRQEARKGRRRHHPPSDSI